MKVSVVIDYSYHANLLNADEHQRVQKKVFSNWINYYVPNCIQSDLIEELRDGTKLLTLLEALTGEQLVSFLSIILSSSIVGWFRSLVTH